MITVQIQTTPLPTITRALASDWGPGLRYAAGVIAIPIVAAYAAGVVTGDMWHRLLQWWRQHHIQGLVRLGLPGAPMDLTIDVPRPAVLIHRQAAAPAPVITRRESCRRLQAQGLSPAKIGRELGISRSTVRRELAA